MANFSDRVKYLRSASGLSQIELAERNTKGRPSQQPPLDGLRKDTTAINVSIAHDFAKTVPK